jgi:type I restriction enzyme S subunit
MSERIPEGWSLRQVKDIATVFAGGTPSRDKPYYFNGKNPWVKSGELNRRRIYSTEEHISDEAIKSSSARWVNKDSVLIAMYGATAGKVARLKIDATINQAISAVIGIDGLADNGFLFHALEQNSSSLLNTLQGSGQPNLSGTLIKHSELLVPPVLEQQKIAAILTSVDDVIEKTEAQINKFQDLKKGMMQELLTKGIGHTEFKDSPVGRIPKGWEICNLEEVCTRIGVGIASSTTHAYTNSGVPIIRNQNIREGELDSSDLLFITEKFSKENESKKIKEGDVLTIRTGYPGVSAVVPSRFHNCHSFTTLISTPRHDVLDSEYLALWVNSDYGRKFVLGGQAGGAQQNLNVSILKQLLVLLPRLDEQKEITNSINSLHAKTKLIGRKLEYYANIKKALMQDLLTGKVRVKVD